MAVPKGITDFLQTFLLGVRSGLSAKNSVVKLSVSTSVMDLEIPAAVKLKVVFRDIIW